MWICSVFLGFYGICAGSFIAASFLAFLSMVGIVPRLATTTKSAKYAMTYETCISIGGIFGSVVYIFNISLPFGVIFLIVYGLFGGIFVGCLIGALAEMLKSLPIFMNRMELKTGIAGIVYGIAFGKCIGCLLQFYG